MVKGGGRGGGQDMIGHGQTELGRGQVLQSRDDRRHTDIHNVSIQYFCVIIS